MTSIKEIKSKKLPYTELDEESKEFLYQMFKRYVVRRQITENSKKLSSLFSTEGKRRLFDYADGFKAFNNAFVGGDYQLIHYLENYEIEEDYFLNMTNDQFDHYLRRSGGSFERKMAIICFSHRKSERIANRLDFDAMVAYANMQSLVLKMARIDYKKSLYDIFEEAGEIIHKDFCKKHGYSIRDCYVADVRTDYKSIGKQAAKLWKQMFMHYMKGLDDLEVLDAGAFMLENFIFSEEEAEKYKAYYDAAMTEAHSVLMADRAAAEKRMEENPDFYVPADYDEIFSTKYAEEVYERVMKKAIAAPFYRYMRDPIFDEQSQDKKKGE